GHHEPRHRALGLGGGDHRVDRLGPRLGLHHHAGPAAVRRVVHGAVHVVGPVPQLVQPDVEDAAAARPADERHVERREVLGEDRDDVDAHHSASSGLSSPRGGSITSRPASRSTSGTIALTNGMSTSRPAWRTTSRSWPWCSTSVTSPTSSPPTVTTFRPMSWWS